MVMMQCSAQPDAIFIGGNGQGYDHRSITPSLPILYSGGIGLGYDVFHYTPTLKNFFNGGIGQGYSIRNISSLKNYFNGGNGPGYDIRISTPQEFVMGIGGASDGYDTQIFYQEFIWTGAVGDGWNVPGNWNYNVVPDINRLTIISYGVPHYPFINSGIFSIGDNPLNGVYLSKELHINKGAELTTRINNLVRNYGKIIIDGKMTVKNSLSNAFINSGELMINSTGQLIFDSN